MSATETLWYGAPAIASIADREYRLAPKKMGTYGGYIAETLVTLVAVCGVAWLVLFGARRAGLGRAAGPIELVGQLPLDARRCVYLVRIGGQVIVIGAGDGGMTKLGEIAASELPAPLATTGTSFSSVLGRVLGRREAGKGP